MKCCVHVVSCNATFPQPAFGYAFDMTPCCCLITDASKMLVAFARRLDKSPNLGDMFAAASLYTRMQTHMQAPPVQPSCTAPNTTPFMYSARSHPRPRRLRRAYMHAIRRGHPHTSPSGDASQTRRAHPLDASLQSASSAFAKQEKRLCHVTSDSLPSACACRGCTALILVACLACVLFGR